MARPEITPLLHTLIDAAFGRVRSKLRADVIGHAKRLAAVDRLNAIKDSILEGGGEIPYLIQLGLTPADGPQLEEMRPIIELLEAIQALAEWQISSPIGVDVREVQELFLRIDRSSPWNTPAEINFREGNVSPAAQRMIRRLQRFGTSTHGGQMMEIEPILGGRAEIVAISGVNRINTGRCPPQIGFDPTQRIWKVVR